MSLHSTFNVHQHTDVTNKLSRKKMEIYVMKKKFLTLALVLMVAVTLFAATPIEVSGTLTAGYKFTFGGANPGTVGNNNGKATIVSSFTGDHWKVSIGGNLQYGANKGLASATAEIYLDKALKDQGVDMGDFKVTLHAGTGVKKGAYSVFAEKGHDAVKVEMATGDNAGITLGYGSLAKLYFSFFPNRAFPMVVSAQVTPVDGVDVTFGYTNDSAANDLLVTAKADIAKLAGLDFALASTAQFAYDVDAKAMVVGVDAATTIEGIGAYVAYQLAAKAHGLAVGASYSTTVEGFTVGGGADFTVGDLANFGNTWNVKVNASASYALGGATYKLAADYDVDKKEFTLTPTVTIKF